MPLCFELFELAAVDFRAVRIVVDNANLDVFFLDLFLKLVGNALEHAALLLHAAFKGADDGGPE